MRETLNNLDYMVSMTQKIKDSICATKVSNCLKCCCGKIHNLKSNKWKKCKKFRQHETKIVQGQLFEFLMYTFLQVFFKKMFSSPERELVGRIIEFELLHEKSLNQHIAIDFFTRLLQYKLQFNSRSEALQWLDWIEPWENLQITYYLMNTVKMCTILGRNEAESQHLADALRSINGRHWLITFWPQPQLLVAQFEHGENVVIGFKGMRVMGIKEEGRLSPILHMHSAEKVYIDQFIIDPEQGLVRTKTEKSMNGIEAFDMLCSEKEKAINNEYMVVVEPECKCFRDDDIMRIDGRILF
jgi:hypothetical protein